MILEVENLSKQYGKSIANDSIRVCFNPGINGLLGANGAGKTTLMKMLVTNLKPTGGRIMYNGRNIVENENEYRNLLGYLPQEFNGIPELSAGDFMYYMGKLKNLSDRDIHEKTKLLLQMVSLSELTGKKIKTFSGGMKRRLGIAQALLNDPKILVLDEPTAGLDPKERIKFRNIISKISRNSIIILSTHIVSDVEDIADNIVIMNHGKVSMCGTKNEIVDRYKGRIWNINLTEKEAAQLDNLEDMGNYKVEDDKSITLKVMSDTKPHPYAHQVDPQLEDIFLNIAGKVENT